MSIKNSQEKEKFCSVVMPVHNGEKFLREAIDSVLNQTYSNFELLIIENCSTDKSLEIIKSYDDARIRIIHEENCGIVQAYNRGFKEAYGKYIIIQDQDDVSLPYRIEYQLNFLIKNNLDICGSSFSIIDENGDKIKNIYPSRKREEIQEKIFYNFFTLFNPTLILRRKILVNSNYFDIKYEIGTDYDFLLKNLVTSRINNSEEILLKYRIHSNNTSSKNRKSGEKIIYKIAIKYFDKYKTSFSDSNLILAKMNYFYGKYYKSCINVLKSIFTLGINKEKIKYLSFSTIFAIPLFILRKRGLFYNKHLNLLIEYFKSKDLSY